MLFSYIYTACVELRQELVVGDADLFHTNALKDAHTSMYRYTNVAIFTLISQKK